MSVEPGTAVRKYLLFGIAVFAMLWAIARAIIQSITIDEAFTYVVFVWHPHYWRAASNNHTLNSVLMGLSTKLFGLSELTARLPALFGAAIYIGAVFHLCKYLSRSLLLQTTLFVCLVYNPFIFDYLVAARGYSLALGFLMWAIVCAAVWHRESESASITWLSANRACAISSLCIGLSVSANLSFAIVDAVTMCVIGGCVFLATNGNRRSLLWSLMAPGGIAVLIFPAYAILHWPKGELFYGAHSLRETLGTIIDASLYQTQFKLFQPLIFPAVGLTGLLWVVFLVFRSKSWNRQEIHQRWLSRFAVVLMTIAALSLALHWMAFHVVGLLLPQDRTAIYLFPLLISAIGATAAITPVSRVGFGIRLSVIASLILMASHFLLCLRLNYFKEWQWDADVRSAYSVLSCLNRTNRIQHVAASWSYHVALNFYRLERATPMSEIVDESWGRKGIEVFVIDTVHTPGVLEKNNLTPFYHSSSTDLVLAADQQLAQTLHSSPCLSSSSADNSR